MAWERDCCCSDVILMSDEIKKIIWSVRRFEPPEKWCEVHDGNQFTAYSYVIYQTWLVLITSRYRCKVSITIIFLLSFCGREAESRLLSIAPPKLSYLDVTADT